MSKKISKITINGAPIATSAEETSLRVDLTTSFWVTIAHVEGGICQTRTVEAESKFSSTSSSTGYYVSTRVPVGSLIKIDVASQATYKWSKSAGEATRISPYETATASEWIIIRDARIEASST